MESGSNRGSRQQGEPSAIRPDFIPASSWLNPENVRLERERLWPRVWQMACREEELLTVGAFVNYEILDDSILIVRIGPGEDDLVAYYNVCQHRGRKLRSEKKGQLGRTISCRFHGWQWTIDGKIAHVHHRDNWEGCPHFTDESIALPPVKLARWGGWIWIHQGEDPEPLEEWLGEAGRLLEPFDMRSMRARWWKTIAAPVNWRVVCEAFNEGYHVWSTHSMGVNYRSTGTKSIAFGDHSMFRGTVGGRLLSEYKTDDGSWKMAESVPEYLWAVERHTFRTLGAMTLEPTMAAADRVRQLPADTPVMDVVAAMWAYQQEEFANRGLKWPERLTREAFIAAGTNWHIFPNAIVLPTVDGALWYRMRPNGDDPDKCLFDIWSFAHVPPGEERGMPEQELFDGFEEFTGQCPFLEEDFLNLAAVNEGMKSRGWKGARTNPVQEVSITTFHAALERYLGG
jgi:phenylpropionate dioxygenase-like ring-hydroxylating dioxygenase large terminal subunit